MEDWKKQFDNKFLSKRFYDDDGIPAFLGQPKGIKHFIDITIQETLQDYTDWLVKNGYTDTDPIFEEPKAVDEYLKLTPKQ